MFFCCNLKKNNGDNASSAEDVDSNDNSDDGASLDVDNTDDDDDASDDDDDNDDDSTDDDDDNETTAPLTIGMRRKVVDRCAPLSLTPEELEYFSCKVQGPLNDEYEWDNCRGSQDCTEHQGGFCMHWYVCDDEVVEWCECVYDECQSDSDCPEDKACACRGTAIELNPNKNGNITNKCKPSNCRTDDDCPGGEVCMAHMDYCSKDSPRDAFIVNGFYCTTNYDSCRNHETCNTLPDEFKYRSHDF